MKLIVILGITGTQGASVADVFLQEPNWRVRGITRDSRKESSKALAAKGVEMVDGDLDNYSTLASAFEGAHAIFSVTDFWQPFFDAVNQAKLRPGQSMNEFCYELELQRGKNIADAANKITTLERFVCSSLSHAKKWSKGKYTWVYHFDSKAAVVEYIREKHPALAQKMSVLQLGLYATHWKGPKWIAPQKQSDDTFVLSLSANPDTPMPMIDTRKDTGYLVRALVHTQPGKTLLGYGSMISWSDYMQLWAKTLGLKGGSYRQVGVDHFDKEAPGGLGREAAEGWAYQGEFGYDGGDPDVVHPKDLGVDCPTTSIEEYIKHEDWSSIL